MKTKTKERKVMPGEKNQCKVRIWKNWTLQKDRISEDRIGEINPDDFDLFIDLVHMRTIVRLANGKIQTFMGPIKKVEGRPWGLLMRLLEMPGKFLTPYEIGYIGEHIDSYFVKDNVQQYAAKLRKHLFRKKKGCKPRFILASCRPYKIAFNGELSFCLVEPDGKGKVDPFS